MKPFCRFCHGTLYYGDNVVEVVVNGEDALGHRTCEAAVSSEGATVTLAREDWQSGRVYYDGRNFRSAKSPRRIVPWNRTVKRHYGTAGIHAFMRVDSGTERGR